MVFPEPRDHARRMARELLDTPSALTTAELLRARTVLIFGEVTTELAERVVAQILALAHDSDAPIRVVLHSPGGHVESGDSIHDVIRFVRAPVSILGSGWVSSAGALIFVAAARDRRLCLPNTRFLLHEPSGGVGGPAADIEIEVNQVLSMRRRLNAIFAEATGKSPETIAKDTERNHWLSAAEAVEYGLVGRIVRRDTEVE